MIHCDLKPENVLLDEDMVAHVSDLGIAKLLGEGETMKQTMTMATIGYRAAGDPLLLKLKLNIGIFSYIFQHYFE